MNTELMTSHSATTARRAARQTGPVRARCTPDAVVLRAATRADAPAIYALIEAHLVEGHLLRRSLDELVLHAPRFTVAERPVRRGSTRTEIVACAELAPLSDRVAEVRSLVVDRSARTLGIGRRLVHELRRSATRAGFDRLCAFTHDAGYFMRKGFSLVPHEWVPEKIARDCAGCALFRTCGQQAVMLPLQA